MTDETRALLTEVERRCAERHTSCVDGRCLAKSDRPRFWCHECLMETLRAVVAISAPVDPPEAHEETP